MIEQIGIVPDYATRILGSLEIKAVNGRRYWFEMLRRSTPTDNGVQRRLRVFVSEKSEDTWSVLSMNLDLCSLLYTKLVTNWPPETLSSVSVEQGLTIEFYDTQPWETPAAPGGFFGESLWEARYDEARANWTISRIRVLSEGDWGLLRTLL